MVQIHVTHCTVRQPQEDSQEPRASRPQCDRPESVVKETDQHEDHEAQSGDCARPPTGPTCPPKACDAHDIRNEMVQTGSRRRKWSRNWQTREKTYHRGASLSPPAISPGSKVLHTRPTRRGLVQATLRYRGEWDQYQPAPLGVSLFPRAGWYRSVEPIDCVTHQRSLQLLAACRTRVR